MYCNYKKNSKMKINGHQKKGAKKWRSEKKLSHIQVIPTIKNATEGVHFARGINNLEYWVKKYALSKPRHNHLSRNTNLATQTKYEDITSLGDLQYSFR